MNKDKLLSIMPDLGDMVDGTITCNEYGLWMFTPIGCITPYPLNGVFNMPELAKGDRESVSVSVSDVRNFKLGNGEVKMITCKEYLMNTYIKNDNGELRDLYVKAAEGFGVKPYSLSTTEFSELAIYDNYAGHSVRIYGAKDGLYSGRACSGRLKQLTLADFQPKKTKVEYVKCEFDTTVEYAQMLDDDVAFDESGDRISSLQSMVYALDSSGVFRRVETEFTWKDELKESLAVRGIEIGIDGNYIAFPECGFTDNEFIDMCNAFSKGK